MRENYCYKPGLRKRIIMVLWHVAYDTINILYIAYSDRSGPIPNHLLHAYCSACSHARLIRCQWFITVSSKVKADLESQYKMDVCSLEKLKERNSASGLRAKSAWQISDMWRDGMKTQWMVQMVLLWQPPKVLKCKNSATHPAYVLIFCYKTCRCNWAASFVCLIHLLFMQNSEAGILKSFFFSQKNL